MGYKLVCLKCQKAFSRDADYTVTKLQSSTCPECGEVGHAYSHRFRPPAKLDKASWQLVRFLFEHGFVYQHIYKETARGSASNQLENYAEYPTTMHEAREFVEQYRAQARNIIGPNATNG